MRFKARVERDKFAYFLAHVKYLSEVSKTAVLHLASKSVTAMAETDDKQLTLHTTLTVEGGFTEYRIESKNDDNAIGLEVLLPNLMQALSSGTKAINVIIKLSKRGTSPFLTVISEVGESAVSVTQDVPVRVLSAAQAASTLELRHPSPDLRVLIPSPKTMLAVVERMKGVSKHIKLHGDVEAKQLTLAVNDDSLKMASYFRDIVSDDPEMATAKCSAVVFSRELYRAFKTLAPLSEHHNLLLCMCKGSAIVLHINDGDTATYTFVITMINTGDDDGAVAPSRTATAGDGGDGSL